ncbi:hypothetical protein K438DRAFT_1810759 [Mycena galopus ATCC 62051]|nr:hypothetical protein K438DRAFT_1810759 [Mycena galopus ATCC 62051]
MRSRQSTGGRGCRRCCPGDRVPFRSIHGQILDSAPRIGTPARRTLLRRASGRGLLHPRKRLPGSVRGRGMFPGATVETGDVHSQSLHWGASPAPAHLAVPGSGLLAMSRISSHRFAGLSAGADALLGGAELGAARTRILHLAAPLIAMVRPPTLARTLYDSQRVPVVLRSYHRPRRYENAHISCPQRPHQRGALRRACAHHGHRQPALWESQKVSALLRKLLRILPRPAHAQMAHPAIYAAALTAATLDVCSGRVAIFGTCRERWTA